MGRPTCWENVGESGNAPSIPMPMDKPSPTRDRSTVFSTLPVQPCKIFLKSWRTESCCGRSLWTNGVNAEQTFPSRQECALWATSQSPDVTESWPRPFQPGQKVSPAYRKCECFVILTEAIWIKVRSAANRVGTCAIFVTAHPRLKRMRTTFLKPSPMSGKLNWGGKFYSCTKVLKEKVFIRPLQGQSMISMRSRWSDVFQF